MLNPAAFWLRKVARKAARNHHWSAAATAYRAYLDRRPGDARTWVQYGHASKETGNFRVAADAYGRALAIDPGMAETWWHLAYVRKRLGDRAGAVDCCVRILMLDPTCVAAVDELVALGAHQQIPAQAKVAGMAVPFDDDAQSGSAIYPLSRYDAFRRAVAIAKPPSGPTSSCPLTIVIDARVALPADARATLSTLLDQTNEGWQALVLAPPRIQEHPVASLATLDHRVRFVGAVLAEDDLGDARHILLIAAGTLLDRQAIAWFAYAAARTGCVAAYCDHDRSIDHWQTGRRFMQPVFHPMFDPDWFAHPGHAPLAVLIDHARMPMQDWHTDDKARTICAAAAIGPVAHLPLLLASERMLTPQAEQAPPDAWAADDPATPPASVPAQPARPDTRAADRIQVVIQTRDEAEMLRSAIDSLQAMASRPDLLDIVVVDNRSREAATARLLAELRQQETTAVLTHDAPFNWSHANNIAVETGTAPLLLFLNNDTQMLTNGWDDLVRDALSVQDVGALGATLFYPDRTIQHAGIVMGMGTGGPVHEGVGRDDASGPNERWRSRRTASAVTGAFLAMPRDLFDAIGGFDAVRFAIAFNDINLCLRIRAAGRRIVMMSDIHVIHHESKTRGTNVTRSQVAWDLDELGRMHDRWGAALFDDPAYNPHWADIGPPFDGCRVPSRREIMRHIDRSARPNPWVPVDTQDEPVWW